ncbi:hypothetical protein BvMPK_1473 [Phocaeicola vulgatus]|uniref:Uncharacterized protein n=1 Tax=Phocaeicola vulgatus TaxID=821 RepID=A0A0P0L3Q5_PHOVU|nr:hypothetical protein BvMPK_1473 [Phocaeicola vulgatus]
MEILKGNDMTTAEIINQAVKMINEHDFFWCYADYEATAREAARGHMAAFVELINKVSAEVRFVELINKVSAEVREALKDLWMARHEWAKKNMFEIDREALRVYEVKEAAVLAALTTPTDLLMVA